MEEHFFVFPDQYILKLLILLKIIIIFILYNFIFIYTIHPNLEEK